MSYLMSQSVKDSIADAETLRLMVPDSLMDWAARKFHNYLYSVEDVAWTAEFDAHEAFRVCPELRG
jgi:hypothetical protein